MQAIDAAGLDEAARIDLDVVRTAHETAAEGFEFPYGDVALLNQNWSWRNAPYVVAQNTGAFLEIPSLLDEQHTVDDARGCRSLSRAARGLCRPARRRDRAPAGGGGAGRDRAGFPARQDARPVTHRARRQRRRLAGRRLAREDARRTWRATSPRKAAKIATDKIAPALDRQIAELEAHRERATADAGVWKLPQGDAYYAWTLRAATTTRMTPDEIHDRGREELAALQSEMDTILKGQGLTQGTRRRAHDGARQGSALPVPRRRRGPRAHHGAARGPRRRHPRAAAARVRDAGAGQLRDQAHGARSRAGRAGRLRRPGQHRRQGAGQVLDQPAHDRPLDARTACRR